MFRTKDKYLDFIKTISALYECCCFYLTSDFHRVNKYETYVMASQVRFCFARKCPPRTFEMSAPHRAVLPLFLQYGTVTPCRMAIQLIDSGCQSPSVASRPSYTKTSSRQRALHHISSHLTFLITGGKTRKFTSNPVLRQHHRFRVISGCRGRS